MQGLGGQGLPETRVKAKLEQRSRATGLEVRAYIKLCFNNHQYLQEIVVRFF